jgi:hypothetical protein
MCFSAISSFSAAGMLTGIGMLALLSIKRTSAYPRALIPFGFALQQMCEGVVWVTYDNPEYYALTHAASVLFLIFAMIVWPVWIPFSLTIAERSRVHAYKLGALTVFGVAIAAYGAFLLYTFPVSTSITCHSIAYMYGNMTMLTQYLYTVAYVCAVVAPFFVSTTGFARLYGVLLSVALIVAWWAWYATAGSVWCFFAALLSSLIVAQLYFFEQ